MRIAKVIAIALAVLIASGAGLYFTGYGGQLFFAGFMMYNEPSGEFNAADAVPAPDYSRQQNWASLPEMEDPADLVPAGIDVLAQGDHPIDTFFIHPTGYLTSGSWTSPMAVDSGTEENTQWMMANQASAYNGCCNVYAPRYREANIFAYFGSEAERSAVLGFAYEDVKRAFEYYLAYHNGGRPFILAGHSQGTHHALRLIAEVIDPGGLHERMVAAYLIGAVLIPVSPEWFAGLSHIKPCAAADDLHCVVHWDTMPEGTNPIERGAPSLCTNPLTWRVDEELAGEALNEGALAPTGEYIDTLGKAEDKATGQQFDALGTPEVGLTGAQCRDGSLFAERQTDSAYAAMGSALMDTYHGLDYSLFYMNIHNNARLRARTHLARGASALDAPRSSMTAVAGSE
jgi:hypothetical protein